MDNYLETGLDQYDKGEYEAAINSFTKALRLALGDLAEILMYRAMAFAALGDYPRAYADFDECLNMNEGFAAAWHERANTLKTQEKFRDALQDYSTALLLDSEFVEARFQRALCYEELGMYAEAAHDLTLVIGLNPGIAPAYEARARMRTYLRDYDEAITDYQRYLRMGGGREYDNQSEIQATILTLRARKWFARLVGWRRG
jgi:tetratricopeptide (TPR) repeat protein